jgi:hypothetical protein
MKLQVSRHFHDSDTRTFVGVPGSRQFNASKGPEQA